MKRFISSLSLLLLTVPIAMAQSAGSGSGSGNNVNISAASSALQTLATWSQPAIESIAVLILIIGIVAAAFELFKRSIGWAIGLFIGASVMFAVLWGIAGPIQTILQNMASAVSVQTSSG
jgi:hypothetical protein